MNSLHSLNIKGNELNNLHPLICFMDNLVELNIEGNPFRQIPNIKSANLLQIKEYLQTKLSNEDIKNMPENLRYFYNRKKSGNNNTNNNNLQINRNSPIFNYIKNNSELVITNTELMEIPFNDIQQNIPPNFLTAINLSSNQIESGLENFNNIIYIY